jgi:hypothetical protein
LPFDSGFSFVGASSSAWPPGSVELTDARTASRRAPGERRRARAAAEGDDQEDAEEVAARRGDPGHDGIEATEHTDRRRELALDEGHGAGQRDDQWLDHVRNGSDEIPESLDQWFDRIHGALSFSRVACRRCVFQG